MILSFCTSFSMPHFKVSKRLFSKSILNLIILGASQMDLWCSTWRSVGFGLQIQKKISPKFGDTFYVTLKFNHDILSAFLIFSWRTWSGSKIFLGFFGLFNSFSEIFRFFTWIFLKCFVEFHTLYVASPFRIFSHWFLPWVEFWFHDAFTIFFLVIFFSFFSALKFLNKYRVILAAVRSLKLR